MARGERATATARRRRRSGRGRGAIGVTRWGGGRWNGNLTGGGIWVEVGVIDLHALLLRACVLAAAGCVIVGLGWAVGVGLGCVACGVVVC